MALTMSVLVACTRAPSPATVPSAEPQPPVAADFLLPTPVYFLRDGQIWRLARDAATLQQITREATPVTDLDVSPVDGALVYVTDNQLVKTDAHGENRQVLVSGPRLPPVDGDLASLNDKSHVAGRLATPRWSPGGDHIAYIQNGLNVISVPGGKVETVHPNDPIPAQGDGGFEDPQLFMGVIAWSPDGLFLLVEVYRYPLSSLFDRLAAIKSFSDGTLVKFSCAPCDFAWSADSQYVYTANPYLGGIEALARFSIAGGQSHLLGQDVPARFASFYAYPQSPNRDEVYVFMASSANPGEPPATFQMVRGPADGRGSPTPLRTDAWPLETALWTIDSSGALIVTSSASNGVQADTLVWLPADGGPAIVLPVTGPRILCWGASL
jgi:Tol biopolymer transport system component